MLVLLALLLLVTLAAIALAFTGIGLPGLLKRLFSFNLEGAVLTLPGLYADDGLGLSEIATALSEDPPATRRALQSLAVQGRVEHIPGSGQRWRLTPAYRALIDPPDLQRRR